VRRRRGNCERHREFVDDGSVLDTEGEGDAGFGRPVHETSLVSPRTEPIEGVKDVARPVAGDFAGATAGARRGAWQGTLREPFEPQPERLRPSSGTVDPDDQSRSELPANRVVVRRKRQIQVAVVIPGRDGRALADAFEPRPVGH
jgi:hypothetical protein